MTPLPHQHPPMPPQATLFDRSAGQRPAMVAIALLLPAFAAAADKAPSDLVLFRKVVVVVHDTFIDPARFEPRRMLVGAMRAFADASAGALEVTADSDAMVVRAGGVEGRCKSTTRSI